MNNPDMSQYLGVFLDEGNEQLALLEAEILRMEQGDHSKEILQSLFRAAHTLKGSSRAMGFMEIGNLTHEMENVLDDLRNDKITVTTAIVDALLDCLDALTALMGAVSEAGTDSAAGREDIPELVARLDALRNDIGPTEAAAAPADSAPSKGFGSLSAFTIAEIADSVHAGQTVFEIAVEIDPDCIMKTVRAYMVNAALTPLGTILLSDPKEDDLDDATFSGTLNLLFATEKQQSEVKDVLQKVSELKSYSVEPYVHHEDAAEAPKAESASEPVSKPAAVPELTLVTSKEPVAAPTKAAVQERASSAKAASDAAATQTIRVGLNRLDSLLNLVGELVIDRTQVSRLTSELRDRFGGDECIVQLGEAMSRISRITSELQEEVMKTRMLPIDGVFQRMPRMVRDLAQKVGKEIDFNISGGETELDRSVLEVLGDPLIHILRNSLDHGIEKPEDRTAKGKPAKGTVGMSARYEESHIVIEIVDDGNGIDPQKIRKVAVEKGIVAEAAAASMSDKEAINLIMASGFSTAAVVSDISGRGVGMDIVRSNLEKIGGRVFIESKPGIGSKFSIHLPLTLAIVRALLVLANSQTYIIPLSAVIEMLSLGDDDEFTRSTVAGQAVVIARGRTIPLIGLSDMLEGNPGAGDPKRIGEDALVVVVGHGENRVGICVDSVAGEQEVVIKSMGSLLGEISGLSGASILGDGRVALIVDVNKAIEEVRHLNRTAAEPALRSA